VSGAGAGAGRAAVRSVRWLLPAAIVLIALNLRGPVVAVAPVIQDIRADLGLSPSVAGLLTTIPVLCFALATPLASWLIGRLDPERAVTAALTGVLVGTVIRSGGSAGALVVGTAVIGIAITIGNVVIPVVIRRDSAPERVGIVTGVYTSALNIGSMITSLGTAPIAAVWGWPVAIAIWGGFVVIAIAVWSRAVGVTAAFRGVGRTGPGRTGSSGSTEPLPVTGPVDQVLVVEEVRRPAAPVRPARRIVTWGLLLAFAGQAFSYYALTAWIPTLLHDEIGFDTASAGASSSVFQIVAVVGALGVPILATRWRPRRIIVLISVFWMAMPVGLLLAPQLWLLWSIFGGAAQGGGITIVFIVIVRLVTNDGDARRLSALVQGGGYLLGSTCPLVAGSLHEATGGWTAPLLVVVAAVLVLGVVGSIAARDVD